MKKQDIKVPTPPEAQVFIAYLGDTAREKALKLTADLRQADISAIMSTGDKSLKAQLRQANSLGARWAVIIGEEELKAGAVTLRDMADASQETVVFNKLAGRLKQ